MLQIVDGCLKNAVKKGIPVTKLKDLGFKIAGQRSRKKMNPL